MVDNRMKQRKKYNFWKKNQKKNLRIEINNITQQFKKYEIQ